MILFHYTPAGMRRTADFTDIFTGQTALLVGGAPSLKEQPLDLLAKRGVLTMAMNNAGLHFQPTLWCGVDRPECYEPQIMLDPRIMKFGNIGHADIKLDGRYSDKNYYGMPNMYFFMVEPGIPWEEYLAIRRGVPWYSNTLFVSIYLLYHMGIRRIILAGSDFSTGANGTMYAHGTNLSSLQSKWNVDLYNSQVHELRRLKPIFDNAGLEFMDCSVNSRISQVYQKVAFERAIELCLEKFPAKPVDPATLPHCSKFATVPIQDRIAQWPGYTIIGNPVPQNQQVHRDARKNVI